MKQKIVIKMSMPCEKSRRRAMELAARATGVTSVGITPYRLEVVGDHVDAACLVHRLRKKVGWAEIVNVGELKDMQPEAKKKDEEKNKPVEEEPPQPLPQCHPGYIHYYYCPPMPQMVICDKYDTSCSIM